MSLELYREILQMRDFEMVCENRRCRRCEECRRVARERLRDLIQRSLPFATKDRNLRALREIATAVADKVISISDSGRRHSLTRASLEMAILFVLETDERSQATPPIEGLRLETRTLQ